MEKVKSYIAPECEEIRVRLENSFATYIGGGSSNGTQQSTEAEEIGW